jgi:undecaprenyl-diphosphatase
MAIRESEERSGWSFACLTISVLLFAAVTIAVLLGLTDGVDATVRAAVNSLASPSLTALFEAVTFFGSAAFIYTATGVTAVVLWFAGRRPAALHLVAVMAAAAILNNVVKMSIARERPEAFFGDLPESYSFASGHALFSACFFPVTAGLVAADLPKAWQRACILISATVIIGGIGLSRIYLGVHHPTDVIAGFALAAMIVCSVRGLFAR